jgi:hypothetical protein
MKEGTIDPILGFTGNLCGLASIPVALVLVPAIGDSGAVAVGMFWASLAVLAGILVLESPSFKARVLGIMSLVFGMLSVWALGIALAFGSSLMSALQIPG